MWQQHPASGSGAFSGRGTIILTFEKICIFGLIMFKYTRFVQNFMRNSILLLVLTYLPTTRQKKRVFLKTLKIGRNSAPFLVSISLKMEVALIEAYRLL